MAIIRVPADYPTIQLALNAASNSDIVQVGSNYSGPLIATVPTFVNFEAPAELSGIVLYTTGIGVALQGGSNVTVFGSNNSEFFLRGNEGNNLIDGGGGDDTIRSSGGLDTLRGGDGNDEFEFANATNARATIIGGAGDDTLAVSATFASSSIYTNLSLQSIENLSVTSNFEVMSFNFAQLASFTTISSFIANDPLRFNLYGPGGVINLSTKLTSFDAVDITLLTNSGADIVLGGEDDRVQGSAFADRLDGRFGDDTLVGGGGNDTLEGGLGADSLVGGAGIDTASYLSSNGVRIALDGSLVATTSAIGDILSGIDSLIGSASGPNHLRGDAVANSLTGGSAADTLDGAGGNDLLIGGVGADTLIGALGIDTASYSASLGVRVSLDGTIAATGEAIGDTFSGIENLTGSLIGANYLRGNAGDNTLTGGAGRDGLDGGDGNDVLVGGGAQDGLLGGAGVDTADYSLSAGVRVSLDGTVTGTGDAAGDAFSQMEALRGSALGNDLLRGNAGNNILEGQGGNDGLDGATGNDVLIGGAGADGMVGDDGVDLVSYANSSGVRVALDGSLIATGDAAGDAFSRVEAIQGSLTSADHLRGNASNNTISGEGGNDSLEGGLGDDWLLGGAGIDTLDGGAGNDSFLFIEPIDPGTFDTILNFSVADDSIRLSLATFPGITKAGSFAAPGALAIGAAASEADDRIIYNSATGALSYDADGTGAAAQVQFAQLSAGLSMTNMDFLIVA